MKAQAQRFDPRQQMQGKTFEIFHYREPPAEEVQIHHHDFYEVYFLLDGDVEYWVDGRVYHLRSGDLLLINPMEFHRPLLREENPVYERIVLWINKDYLEHLTDDAVGLSRCFDKSLPTHTNFLRPSSVQRSALHAQLGALIRESYGTEYGHTLYAGGVFLQFMAEVNRLALHGDARRSAKKSGSSLVSQVLDYIGEHYSDELSLESLADRFFVNKYHLAHEFSREVGTGIHRYILMKRLFAAHQRLSQGGSPGDVYLQCGFREYSSFYRAFKAEYGIRPRDCGTE